MKAVVISSIGSGNGKTVSSICIEVGLKKIGKNITAFKFGPDFIDPSYHRLFTECYNLDPIMSSTDFVKYLFSQKASEYNVVEGAMGLFDGELSGSSTFELSKILGARIILCIDVSGMGESIRAIVKGLKKYVSGVIAVKVASEQHLQIIKKSLEKEKVDLIGYIPKSKDFEFPSRHLGLYLSEEVIIKKEEFERAFFKFFDIEKLLKIFSDLNFEPIEEGKIFSSFKVKDKVSFGILSGKPFSFVYPENIFVLKKLGFEVEEIKLGERKEVDVLFIPGGYPENLSQDEMREVIEHIKLVLDYPKLIIAECGGLEILSQRIFYKEKKLECLGVFPFEIKIEERFQALGWRKLKNEEKNLYILGHEFRYGKISNLDPAGIFLKYDSKGRSLGTDGFKSGKFLAFWTHLYLGSNPSGFAKLIYDFQN